MSDVATEPVPAPSRAIDNHPALQQVETALAALQFGTIQLTVHNGRLVQVDVTERHRFTGPAG